MQWTAWCARALDVTRCVPVVVGALIAAAMTSVTAREVAAQSGKLGIYAGTVAISGKESEDGRTTTFRGTVTVKLPVTDKSADRAHAEVDDIESPSASVKVTQWDISHRASSANSDGQFTTWTCSLAEPVEVPMTASGALDVDYRKKVYAMYVSLVARETVPLSCSNSRSGPYKKDELVSFFFGTSEPDRMPADAQRFTDAGRLTATFTMVPVSMMKERYGPVALEWDLRLVP